MMTIALVLLTVARSKSKKSEDASNHRRTFILFAIATICIVWSLPPIGYNMSQKLTHDFVEERAVLVGLITNDQNESQAKEYLEELDFLAHTAGAIAVKHFTQKLAVANPKTFVGKGKLIEIKRFIKDEDIQLVIFDDELGPSQLRNIEKELNAKY